MKTFGDTVDYRHWVEEIAENVEQVGSVRSGAELAVSEVYNYQDREHLILLNGEPVVDKRAPPSEIFKHTFEEYPYHAREGSDWRGVAVACLMEDIRTVQEEE